MASPRSDHDDLMSQYYGSPTSTTSSVFGRTYDSSAQRDDNLPEVVEVSSPVALTNMEAEYQRRYAQHDEGESTEKLKDSAKVVVPSEHSAGDQYPQTAVSTTMVVPWDATTVGATTTKSEGGNEKALADEASGGPPKDRKIMGMRRRPFFILLAVVVVIVVAAVGGGVGGAVAATRNNTNNNNNNNHSDAAATSSMSSVTPTQTASQASSTTSSSATATPTFLNNQTTSSGNGFKFQGFSRDNYTGAATTVITEEGGTDFEFDIHSYVWLPRLTSCCISFCKNATKAGMTGWWCNERYQKQSSESFPRLFVWCGGERTDAAAKCS
ncbi:hypothetical protein QQS21_001956 [Conoideocrella luteorostrata]|uniref:Transmembrane protein n=1 Tax=Conoideocrella luteorostrata TaxID=1105319 RepID=A0AAJ0CVY9_9HYPO|nr:hypothetical protein QQS21_001956 [Conoideocrella luteorostrata]